MNRCRSDPGVSLDGGPRVVHGGRLPMPVWARRSERPPWAQRGQGYGRVATAIATPVESIRARQSPAARLVQGARSLPTRARRGLRKENPAMPTEDADDLEEVDATRVPA